ncbi:hypothetical protein EWM64_g5879 [Hericium alpestre]|uniref:Cation-transporting ATPase n=1 Tax=Hericium alpestre TaxID=135208 RepID=A0A4Y9ZVE3_9AGAM|nr:hypothetical protein EWM64_g5879 [Hericium alpestre]
MFDNIASLFGHDRGEAPRHHRRRSLSQRSTASSSRFWARRSDAGSEVVASDEEEEGDDRWGYSSGEEEEPSEDEDVVQSRALSPTGSELEYGSYPPSPTQSVSLPLLSGDQFFGDEMRIDVELEPLEPPPLGPPSRQTIYIPEEDSTVRFVGYETIKWHQWAWRTACVLTFGVLGLLGHWFPKLWLHWVVRECAFEHLEDGCVVIESVHRDIALFPVKRLAYPYPASTVFSGLSASSTATPPALKANANGLVNGNGEGEGDMVLGTLLVVDYRYARFALDPRTGLFSMVKDWRDPSWTGVSSVKNGLEEPVRQQRLTLFGPNVIDIEGKSTASLLVDEIIHPFYVFQIASIVLWSLDDYYYYAFCIALISTLSVATTLIETRKTIARMRQMSRFSCPVSVFVDGIWLERDSSDLVPGDIVNLMEPPLSVLPADLFLLSGDAIVNESMLTGESVPVSKIPVHDEDLARWKESRDIEGETSKSFLYAGTKVVRIRKAVGAANDAIERPALGMVVRTGFNTTKGALVRSMLFPKPMGFKFYRDSIRFIMVLAGIAALGFCASAVQFLRAILLSISRP